MSYAYDIDEALENWDRIKNEQAEAQRLKQVAKAKEALPYSEPLAIEICERVSSGELLNVQRQVFGCMAFHHLT